MLLVRRQRRPASASRARLQSRQLHADAGSAGGGQAVVADEPAGEARQDRRQGRAPWSLRHLPDGRGRGAEEIVPGNLAADRRTATKTGSSVGTEGVGCLITTGGVCLNDEEKGQIGFSGMVRAGPTPKAVRTPPLASAYSGRVLSFTPIRGHLGNVGSKPSSSQAKSLGVGLAAGGS